MSHVRSKTELRRELRLILKNQAERDRAAASAEAGERLRGQAVWKEARSVLLYSAIAGELDLSPLIDLALESGKIALLPRFAAGMGTYEAVRVSHLQRDCAPGKFGIAEPGAHCVVFPLNSLDLALAPGLGFDLVGHRLGRGQGYYDRLLAQIAGAKCGVAFDSQVVGEIPAEAHDIHMNFILTPTRWLEISE
ncbi:MAG TPA: 5-formyltetrahydrofolate cyclo-ligase [Verrucomicrobiae bacterium]|jgi:5-formyltetrahydrofolate cyclo-ligase|nr:5-formyltetrahydrofolate cyclo-ligase [Verrucomicrobiae bacterium]